MSIVLGIKRKGEEEKAATVAKRLPLFWPCCVCSNDPDLAFPARVGKYCRKTHCSGCGAWPYDGSRKCSNCRA